MDSYRIFSTYLAKHFIKLSCNNLKLIANFNLLPNPTSNSGEKGCITLPFSPHIIYHVYAYELGEYYDIGYISESEINMENNSL